MAVTNLERHLHSAMSPEETFRRAFRIPPHEWQVEYLNERIKNILTKKGRQVGASQSAAAKAIHLAKYVPGSLSVIVSPSQKQSQEIALRAKAGIRNIERVPLEQESAIIIRMKNDSRIMSLPGTATSVRGYTAKLLVVDEAAFVEEETWIAARALVATGGQVCVQSTVQGEAGWFYELWMETQANPLWRRFSVPSRDVPWISEEFLASELAQMGPVAFKAEYEAEFLTEGIGLFSGDALRKMQAPGAVPFFAKA